MSETNHVSTIGELSTTAEIPELAFIRQVVPNFEDSVLATTWKMDTLPSVQQRYPEYLHGHPHSRLLKDKFQPYLNFAGAVGSLLNSASFSFEINHRDGWLVPTTTLVPSGYSLLWDRLPPTLAYSAVRRLLIVHPTPSRWRSHWEPNASMLSTMAMWVRSTDLLVASTMKSKTKDYKNPMFIVCM